jgi:hypothetical protein
MREEKKKGKKMYKSKTNKQKKKNKDTFSYFHQTRSGCIT